MRVWRVGTFSMGTSLLFLGIVLLFSRFLGLELYQVMMSWWPIILVVLGIEILVFLFIFKQEKPFLKYDFLSIAFVGILGMLGIGFAILSSTGIIQQVAGLVESKEQTLDIPAFSQEVGDTVKRMVITSDNYPITIESTQNRELAMFGTYRTNTSKNEKLIESAEEILSVNQKGDTLYVEVKGLPRKFGPFDSYSSLSATLLVPTDVKLEVEGNSSTVRLKPRMLLSDWSIDTNSEVKVHVEKNENLKINATGIQEVSGPEGTWIINPIEKGNNNNGGYNEDIGAKTASYQTGKGTFQVHIVNAYKVSLTTQ